MIAPSEKEHAAPTFKRTSAITRCWCSATTPGRPSPGCCGRATPAPTAADHRTVPDAGLAQSPKAFRHGRPILIRADGAGSSHAQLDYLAALNHP